MAVMVVHDPALLKETLQYLDCGPGKTYVDGTVGAGGHAEAILESSGPDGILIGIDRDEEILGLTRERLDTYGKRFVGVHGNFRDLEEIMSRLGIERVHGLLLDLGVSSLQMDSPGRGFSFRAEAPADMRMDAGAGRTAADLIRQTGEEELTGIIRSYGEEPRARLIARAVLDASIGEKNMTTTRLAEIIASVRGGGPRGRRKIHPATRTFQALRIAVNEEMEALDEVLPQIPPLLATGGVCCILSYHSLEDRKVKNFFRQSARGSEEHPEPSLKVLTKKPVRPGEDELDRNPRARSARLRAAMKR